MNTLAIDQDAKSGTSKNNQLSPPSLKDPLYIDVRTPQEFEGMHISGARNIPLPDLHQYVSELKTLPRKDPILLICRTQNRVKIAYVYLINQGLTNGGILEGGITAWVNQGKPVVRGQQRISLEGQVRAITGVLILLGVVFGLTIHSGFLPLPTIVGVGLFHAVLTDSCLMGRLLSRLSFNRIQN